VSPVTYELGFYIPEVAILHSHRRENLKCSTNCYTDCSVCTACSTNCYTDCSVCTACSTNCYTDYSVCTSCFTDCYNDYSVCIACFTNCHTELLFFCYNSNRAPCTYSIGKCLVISVRASVVYGPSVTLPTADGS
jgi:hypothetical protein